MCISTLTGVLLTLLSEDSNTVFFFFFLTQVARMLIIR